MIDYTWQDDGFGNLLLVPQGAWEFNMIDQYPQYFYFIN